MSEHVNDATKFVDDVRVAIAAAVVKSSDGLTLKEFGEFVYDIMRIAVQGLEGIPAQGQQKKQWALDAVAALFDSLADKLIPAYCYPVWVIVRPSARSLLLHFSDGAIESVLRLVRGDE